MKALVPMIELTMRDLLGTYSRLLGLNLIAGEKGLDRTINSSDTHRPGLALTGFVELFTLDQIQLLGNTEVDYLRSLSPQKRRQALEIIFQFSIPCVVVTGFGRIQTELRQLAEEHDIPLLKSDFETGKFIHLIHFYLDEVFAPQVVVHGSLVDVDGVGLLFRGRSGIGKSEVALDLVERGHRLVADDMVVINRKAQGILVGHSPHVLQDHIEIRGIGIMDVKKMFGVRGTRKQKRVEVSVNLVDWDENAAYERLGLENRKALILGVEILEVSIPLFPGKNITVLAETIAMDYLLRLDGLNSAQEFNQRLLERIKKNTNLK